MKIVFDTKRGIPASSSDSVRLLISAGKMSIPTALTELGLGAMPKSFFRSLRRNSTAPAGLVVIENRNDKPAKNPEKQPIDFEVLVKPKLAHEDQRSWNGKMSLQKIEQAIAFVSTGSRFHLSYSTSGSKETQKSGNVSIEPDQTGGYELCLDKVFEVAMAEIRSLSLLKLE
jgi:hypothetical protein